MGPAKYVSYFDDRAIAQASRLGGPGSIPGQVVWGLSVSAANSHFTACSAYINDLVI